MKLGLFGVNIGPCADPALQERVVRAAEESGFESVWTGEHVVLPLRDNPVPVPAETPFLDSLVTLARLAGTTRRLRLGTGILVLPHHNPVLLAKALASLDVVSGGRLIAGFAGGYAEAEFRALGADFARRGVRTDEALRAMRVLWTEPEPRFTGRFWAFADIRFEPKPVQRPHPPIVIGGHAEPALRRAARAGDGWYGFGLTVEAAIPLIERLRALRAESARAGDPLEISLTTFESMTPDLVERAARSGIDRLIWYPLLPAARLEAAVRDLGARLGRAR